MRRARSRSAAYQNALMLSACTSMPSRFMSMMRATSTGKPRLPCNCCRAGRSNGVPLTRSSTAGTAQCACTSTVRTRRPAMLISRRGATCAAAWRKPQPTQMHPVVTAATWRKKPLRLSMQACLPCLKRLFRLMAQASHEFGLLPLPDGERESRRAAFRLRISDPSLLSPPDLRLECRDLRLGARRQHPHLAAARIRHDDLHRLTRTLQDRDVAGLRAAGRQVEQGPLVRGRIVLADLVGAPQVGPGVVAAVDRHLIGLIRFRIGQRNERRLLGVDVDLGERAAKGVAGVDKVAVLVGAHPPWRL